MSLAITLPAELIDELARRISERVSAPVAPATSDTYLDVEAAANYLACDKDRIYDLKALGKVKYAKDGRRLLFRRSWLDAALEVTHG